MRKHARMEGNMLNINKNISKASYRNVILDSLVTV